MPEDPARLRKKSTLREPLDWPVAADLDDTGLPVDVDGGDEEPGEAYLDELRAGD